MVRRVCRKNVVLAATGWSNSTLYDKIARGLFPRGTKIDPSGRVVVWFEDEIEQYQAAAREHAKKLEAA